MSIRVMTQVWSSSPMKGSALLLELAIADFADDAGRAFPSVETLARKIRMSERRTRMLLRDLETSGEVVVGLNDGPHGVNLYGIHPGGQSLPPDISGGAISGREGGNPGYVGGKPIAPEPSVTTKEPSVTNVTGAPRPKVSRPRVDGKLVASVVASAADAVTRRGSPSMEPVVKNALASQTRDLLRGGWTVEEIRETAVELAREWDPVRRYSKLMHLAARQRTKSAIQRENEHAQRKLDEKRGLERVVYEDAPDGRTTYVGHVPVMSGETCRKCGKGLDSHRLASKADLAKLRPIRGNNILDSARGRG